MSKFTTVVTALFSFCVVFSSVSAGRAEPEVKTIRFVGAPSVGAMLIWIAGSKGFFAEEGLELKAANDLAAGLVTDNLLSGQVDMVHGGAATMLIPFAKGAPIVTIAHADRMSPLEIIVPGDSPYRTLADLKGKSVAVIAPNGPCQLALSAVFEREGLPKDFLKYTIIAPPDQVAAFAARRVDASCAFDPYRLQLIKQFGGRSIWNVQNANAIGDIATLSVVRRDFADRNPNTVSAIQRALGKAATAANKDHELVYQALASALKRDVAAVREFSIPQYAEPPSLPKELQRTADDLYKYGYVNAPIDVAAFDRSPLAPAKK
jgi:ABC-type nitrate/sulfonate/bicarbonate transport system substrate-binding protein